MPIYRYACKCCNKTNDYLVGKICAFPEKCSSCDNINVENFERVYASVGFSAITRKVTLSPNGEKHITINRSNGPLEEMVDLKPGMNIISGKDSQGRNVLEITEVCPNHGPVLGLKIIQQNSEE